METWKITLVLFLALPVPTSNARECQEYTFYFQSMVIPGDVSIHWSRNLCSSTKKDSPDRKFAISITNMFGDVYIQDTVSSYYYRFDTNQTSEAVALMISLQEVGNPRRYMSLLKLSPERFPEMPTLLDSLNHFLMNGYLANAASMLHEIGKTDLIEQIKIQYDRLVTPYYIGDKHVFNSYLDRETMSLVPMPYVTGLKELAAALNKSFSRRSNNAECKVYAKISDDDQLLEYKVIPAEYTQHFDEIVSALTFVNNQSGVAEVVIRVGRDKNSKKYIVTNERGLINPDSKEFKTKFPQMGAIH